MSDVEGIAKSESVESVGVIGMMIEVGIVEGVVVDLRSESQSTKVLVRRKFRRVTLTRDSPNHR